jgi:Glycosyl transferase family 2
MEFSSGLPYSTARITELIETGNGADALADIDALLGAYPEHDHQKALSMLKAQALVSCGELTRAQEHLEHLLGVHPDDIDLLRMAHEVSCSLELPFIVPAKFLAPAPPIPETPFVSVILATYNHERYIETSIQSALAQQYPFMEVLIGEDCSTDKTPAIVNNLVKTYDGPHRVRLITYPSNLQDVGFRNWRELLWAARGDYVINFAGDDILYPDYVRNVVDHWKKTGANLICANADFIDSAGQSLGCTYSPPDQAPPTDLREFLYYQGITCTSHGGGQSYSRRLLQAFPNVLGNINNVHLQGDMTLAFFAYLLGSVSFIGQPQLAYRRHEQQTSLGGKLLKARSTSQKVSVWEEDHTANIFTLNTWRHTLTRVRELISGRNFHLSDATLRESQDAIADLLDHRIRQHLLSRARLAIDHGLYHLDPAISWYSRA